MRKHGCFIGVDVSKEKLDVSVLSRSGQDVLYHQVYPNTKTGLRAIIRDLRKRSGCEQCDWLFCLEHTGVYAMPLVRFLAESDIHYSLVPASVIQRSIGLKRGKSDKADSKDIARYAPSRGRDQAVQDS